jgi:hypothetical protein
VRAPRFTRLRRLFSRLVWCADRKSAKARSTAGLPPGLAAVQTSFRMQRTTWLVFAVTIAISAGTVDEELLDAARKGDLASVRTLLEKGAAIETKTQYGQTPLYLAAMNGRADVVQFLLDKGASTDVRDTFYKAPMLGFVLMRKHYSIAKMLITRGAGNTDKNLETVVAAGNADLVQTVLEKGKPSQPELDKAYETALAKKQPAIADLLKKAGAQEPAPGVQVDVKTLESYAGNYTSEQFPLDVKVFVKDGKLYMQPGPEFALKARSATSFESAPARLEVEFDSAGSFLVKQGGTTTKFKKVVTP